MRASLRIQDLAEIQFYMTRSSQVRLLSRSLPRILKGPRRGVGTINREDGERSEHHHECGCKGEDASPPLNIIEHPIHPAYGLRAERYAGCNPSDLVITG